MSNQLVILGANGFVGQTIIKQNIDHFSIKAVQRHKPESSQSLDNNITWYQADLLKPNALEHILEQDDVVINVAHSNSSDGDANLLMIQHMIQSCLSAKIKRLVHCSTAIVVGQVKDRVITESTPCNPITPYEKIKLTMEQCLINARSQGLDVIILRPTGIVGVGGLNLQKMALSLLKGNPFLNYIKACLFNHRTMNFVAVDNVAAALVHLGFHEQIENDGCFIMSSDDDPINHYLNVESLLSQSLDLPKRQCPIIPLPLFILSILLKLVGKPSGSTKRIYDSSKLLATHFTPKYRLSDAIQAFGKQFRMYS